MAKKQAQKRAPKKAVHRDLHLSSPLTRGADVKAVQKEIRVGLKHREVNWIHVTIDGQLGRQTLHAARFYGWVLGFSRRRRKAMAHGLSEGTQSLLRSPEKRSVLDRARERRRKGRLSRLRKGHKEGPEAAEKYARSMIGVTENPAGSNTGPNVTRGGKTGGVSFWERYFGLGACYWCLCFAGYCVKEIGGANVTGWLPLAASIQDDAHAHRNGLHAVPPSQARKGDFLLFCFDGTGIPDHGALCVGPIRSGLTHDIDGNTSSDNSGSQSNGGGVFEKRRSTAQLTCVARPDYGRNPA